MTDGSLVPGGGGEDARAGDLELLARLHGVQTGYRDVFGEVRRPPDEAILRVLRGLGAPVEDAGDVAEAIRARRRQLWRRRVPPSALSREGEGGVVELRVPEGSASGGAVRAEVELEGGGRRSWSRAADDLPRAGRCELDGERFTALELDLPDDLPRGFHRLRVEAGGSVDELPLTAAPATAPQRPEGDPRRAWGTFLPLYALRTERDWGVGDLGDLEELMDWTSERGGSVVATLPLLASSVGGDGGEADYSPYSPVSRLFWNETFLDVDRLARSLDVGAFGADVGEAAVREEAGRLRRAGRVDWGGVAALKRRVLESLAEAFFAGPTDGRTRYERFAAGRPRLEEYARFRAARESRGRPWPEWPEGMRRGRLQDGDVPERSRRYHRFVQWALHEQLDDLGGHAAEGGAGLCLDLPLGVPEDSFDVWRFQDRFVRGFDVGAPPDTFFREGQRWGFPPLHPERIRASGFDYLRACLETHMARCRWLRVDHVMGLVRTYWVPRGFDADQGVYVGYPAAELFGVLSLLARRHGTAVVGEDLGTVPDAVRREMGRHGIHRTHVLQAETAGWARGERPEPPEDSQAGLNTHDMPPFAAFLEGRDLEILLELDHLAPEVAEEERHTRERGIRALIGALVEEGLLAGSDPGPVELCRAALRRLAGGPERLLVVNLEDLWGETTPQNLPGTWGERPNWRWRARRSFQEFARDPGIVELLESLDGLRRGREPGEDPR